MYFTCSFDYAQSYSEMMKAKHCQETGQPPAPFNVVMIALVTPGNPYPVVEDPLLPNGTEKNPDSLHGKPLRSVPVALHPGWKR